MVLIFELFEIRLYVNDCMTRARTLSSMQNAHGNFNESSTIAAKESELDFHFSYGNFVVIVRLFQSFYLITIIWTKIFFCMLICVLEAI